MTDEPQAGPDERRERDFGDSAGYGEGGSTLDYRDVVGTDPPDRTKKPNPLDKVIDTSRVPGEPESEPPAGARR